MNSESKPKTRRELLKELDRLTEVFSNLTKKFKNQKGIEGFEEDYLKAQKDLNLFWDDFNAYKQSSPF